MSNQTPPLPINVDTGGSGGNGVEIAFAHFFRSQFNTNVIINLPIGILSSGIYVSDGLNVIPACLNSSTSSPSVLFGLDSAVVTQSVQISYLVTILFKLTTVNNTNYINIRELRCYPARPNGTIYDISVNANSQPSTSQISTMQISGVINHTAGDVVTLLFQLAQTANFSGDTRLTIFRIDWQMMTIL